MHKWSDFDIDAPIAKVSGHYYIRCPVCSDERKKKNLKTLGVTMETHSWACNHCGFSGSLYKGVLSKGNVNQYSKGTMRIKKEYIKPVYQELSEKSNYPAKLLEWFENRKISEKTIRKNNIGWCNTKFSGADDPEKPLPAITFPFYENEEVVNIKYRGFKEKLFKQSYQAKKTVFGYDEIKKAVIETGEFWIVEGEIDKMSWNEIGFWDVCSVPDGAPHPDTKDYTSKFDFLESCEDIISMAQRVVLCIDDDIAGERLQEELARRIGKEKCYLVKYPEGKKDSNQVLMELGPDALQEMRNTKYKYPISGIFLVEDIFEELDQKFKDGIELGWEMPWDNVTELYRCAKGEFTIVTGIPGSGKSEVIDSALIHFALNYQARIGIFSPEHAMWIHVFRLAEKLVNKPILIRNRFGEIGKDNYGNNREIQSYIGQPGFMTKEEFHEACILINKHFFWIKKERNKKLTLQDLQEKKRSLILRYGVTHFVDDPYNKMDHARPSHMSEHEYISEFLDMYGEFNEDNGCHSFLVAHPTKLKKEKRYETVTGADKKQTRKEYEAYPVATAYDISGSSHWFNKGMNILSIYREGMRFGTDKGANMPTRIYTQKIKFKWNGKLGVTDLYFNPKTGSYYESIDAFQLSQPQISGKSDSDKDDPF